MNDDALPARGGTRASSAWKAVLAWGPRLSHPATGVLLALMIAGGIVLRIQNVGYSFHYGFDEDQFIGAAHQFLVGIPAEAECCHPPFSKLVMAVGMLLLGNNPAGWRFTPLWFGLQSIALAYLIASSLFGSRRAGWLAAAFMAADGFYLAYSRIAFPEGLLACLNLWCILAAVTARGWGGVLVSAVLVGLAMSIKWVSLLLVLPACFAILILRRAPWYSIVSFAIVPFVHLGVWAVGLHLIGHPNDVASIVRVIQHRANLHLTFKHHANPAESAWYTWLVLYHPLVIKTSFVGGKIRLASGVGNMILWIAADLCLVALPVVALASALRTRWRERWLQWSDVRFNQALAILGVAWLSMMLLWISGRIVTYWYHYMTPWGLAMILLAGVVARLDRHHGKVVLGFIVLVLAVSIYFAPVWAEIPISVAASHRRLFPLWR